MLEIGFGSGHILDNLRNKPTTYLGYEKNKYFFSSSVNSPKIKLLNE